jgi:plastocyanin
VLDLASQARRPLAWHSLGLAFVAVLGGLGPAVADTPPKPAHTVIIEGMRFTPESLSVRSGERIVWLNRDLVPHTVTSAAFDSGVIMPNGKWASRAGKRGEYRYACKLHPTMQASLTVE